MNWNRFNTYGEGEQQAFETLCNQLFEKNLRRNYKTDLIKFRVINGAGGDGGIEAYGQLNDNSIIAVQAKWFRNVMDDGQIGQISHSIEMALTIRPEIKEYIICVPREINSVKFGRAKKGEPKKPIDKHEEKRLDSLITKIKTQYPNLTLTWWFDNRLIDEIQQAGNEGIHKYWFDKEVITLDYLKEQFELSKKGWLHERYIAELHGQGIIHKEYQKLISNYLFRKLLKIEIKQVIIDLHTARKCIKEFVNTIADNFLYKRLKVIEKEILIYIEEYTKLIEAVTIGNDLFKPKKLRDVWLWSTKISLEKIKPNNLQKNVLPKLIKQLDNIHKYNIAESIIYYNDQLKQNVRLVLGEPGTGKTHGLTNCVEIHLLNNSPALLIQAKNHPCNNWFEILAKALNLENWTRDEILNAFESLATKVDLNKAKILPSGEQINIESTKMLICIDGLEEDIENSLKWYARMRECEVLTQKYPRLRFIFSARRYFYDNTQMPEFETFESIDLPREGDVSVREIAPKYFHKDNFNIQITDYSIINGLNSLFALRLFCDYYRDAKLYSKEAITTSESELLNLKIAKLDEELKKIIGSKISRMRYPIRDSLLNLATYFYSNIEATHDELHKLISDIADSYLDGSNIDQLIEVLTNHGILVRFERVIEEFPIRIIESLYNITYQSIIEHILTEKTYQELIKGKIDSIPKILKSGMIQPLDFSHGKHYDPFEISANWRIIQNIVLRLFIEHDKLVGEGNVLSNDFDEEQLFELQMQVLQYAPKEKVVKYESKVRDMFFGSYKDQHQVLKHLIIPSSNMGNSYFNAEWLHKILINQENIFIRDKLWSNKDQYEKRDFERIERFSYDAFSVSSAFYDSTFEKLHLSEYDNHNELPLIYAWGLSSINQKFRDDLRNELTNWAIKNLNEYLLLLQKIFDCNDPQIQEDLASITLGVANRVKNKECTQKIAKWAIESIFENLSLHRNVIVRLGFRAIIEKAYLFDLISDEEVNKCRPKPFNETKLIPLDKKYLEDGGEQFYPIVHDLAWYVVKKAYEDFLEYPSSHNGETEDNDCSEAKRLLDEYRKVYNNMDLQAFDWGRAAAIGYIRSLGFDRVTGNHITDASHGSKSKIFTYEEKYTWLAVHYILGYLSDYVPVKTKMGRREFVTDYMQLIDIPNPSESLIDIEDSFQSFKREKPWIIKGFLTDEIVDEAHYKDSITKWVNEEPNIHFEKWLTLNSRDFGLDEPQKWLTLSNYSFLHDSKEYSASFLDIKACTINKDDIGVIVDKIKSVPDNFHFLSQINDLYGYPKTDIYSNPSDIVWMNWIDEIENRHDFYDHEGNKKALDYSVIRTIKATLDGEKETLIPSKKIRSLVDIIEFRNNQFRNKNDDVIGFIHNKKDKRDYQDILLIDEARLKKALDAENLQIIWFADYFKQRNPLKEELDKDFHIRRSRRYMLWYAGNKLNSILVHDEDYKPKVRKDTRPNHLINFDD